LKDAGPVKAYLPVMPNEAGSVLGKMVRRLREQACLSQEQLARKADISYQYLSLLEHGKQNFSIGVLESLCGALGEPLPDFVAQAYEDGGPPARVDPAFFISQAPLPAGLTMIHVEAALNESQRMVRLMNATLRRVAKRPLSAFIQGNSFSGIVSNILCDSFSRLTPYQHNHDQRYPDLVFAGQPKVVGLEVKTTVRPGKGGESHNGHSGWHLVACFETNHDTGDIRFVHAMFAELIGHGKPNADWKYVGSRVNTQTGSRRTETYNTTPVGTAKLRHGTVYLDTSRVEIKRWRTPAGVTAPAYSPFVVA
jgi:transcriptional regulator with XRE-family HTH domain